MHLTQREKRRLVIRKSRNGRGVFARVSFLPEQSIFQVVGKRIECNEDDELDDQTRSNTYRYDDELYLSPAGRIGDLLNHSCEPNAKVVKKGARLYIVAASSIRPGEEIAIDYSTILAADDSWEMQCNCGTRHCRKLIRMFDTLPTATKKNYLSRGMVPGYIAA